MIELQEEGIILDLKSRNKEGVLREMAANMQQQLPQLDADGIFQVVRDREMIGSTGVGNGIAIPHGKMSELDRVLLSFGRSGNGIGFDSQDNQPVHLLVMILSPEEMVDDYLKTLGAVSRLLKDPGTRRHLRATDSLGDIVAAFRSAD